jgi:hypothetical protein
MIALRESIPGEGQPDPDANRQPVAVPRKSETLHDEVFASADDADLFLAREPLTELLDELALTRVP